MSLTHSRDIERATVSPEALLKQPEFDVESSLEELHTFIGYNEQVRSTQLSTDPQFGKLIKYKSIFEIPADDARSITEATMSLGKFMAEHESIEPFPKPDIRIEEADLGENVTIGLYESRSSDLIGVIAKTHTLDAMGQNPVVGFKIRFATKEDASAAARFKELKKEETTLKKAAKKQSRKRGKFVTSASARAVSI